MGEEALVSIVIPAYNAPDLLKRCLASVVSQTHRPLEIIVLDDNSPRRLASVAEEFLFRQGVTLRFVRNEENLKPYWNMLKGWKMAEGEFVVFMPHDDYFLRDDFISIGLASLRDSVRAKVFIANSTVEGANRKMMEFSAEGIQRYSGENFIIERLWRDAHPAYSAVLINNETLRAKNYGSFFYDLSVKDAADVEPDEMLVGIVLASFDNDVLLTSEVFSTRGSPKDSYSRSEFWQERGLFGVFLVSVRMVKFFFQMKRFRLAFFFTKLAAGVYGPEKMDWRVIRFVNYSPSVTVLMWAGILRKRIMFLVRGSCAVLRGFHGKATLEKYRPSRILRNLNFTHLNCHCQTQNSKQHTAAPEDTKKRSSRTPSH